MRDFGEAVTTPCDVLLSDLPSPAEAGFAKAGAKNLSQTKLLDLTLPSPQENLDVDNKLLDETDAGHRPPTLRFWEPPEHFVVLGYSSRLEDDVDTAECCRLGIPVLRRSSGGGTVLLGPGCLNYSLILPIPEQGPLRGIREATCFILRRHRDAIQPLAKEEIAIEGTTDLTLNGRKFSGNAQRRKRHALLFHGTFLYNFEIPLVQRLLHMPHRRPAYRSLRSHHDFLNNLPLTISSIKNAIRSAWMSSTQ